VTSKFILD